MTKRASPPKTATKSASTDDSRFAEVVALIEAARGRAYLAVNLELVSLYWRLGEYLSRKIASAEWGDGIVDELAAVLARRYPGLRGFARPNLFRMRQFYEAYRGDEKVSPLVRQLPWTHHLIILSQAKPPEARQFYMLAAIKEGWTKRELERQIRTGAALRSEAPTTRVSAALRQIHSTAIGEFKNAYNLEFLSLQEGHSEADLHGALLRDLGRFITELGRDFCFVGSEYPVQVGTQDFAIDLVFFHRGLACLVALELKVGKFEPEHLGELGFYVEALDRSVKKAHERLRSVSSSARARTTRWSSTRWPAPPRRRSSPNTRRCCRPKRCSARSFTSCTPSSPREAPLTVTRVTHELGAGEEAPDGRDARRPPG